MEKCRCPYCREELKPQDAAYALVWSKGKRKEDYPELAQFFADNNMEAKSEIRKRTRYNKVWKNYNYSENDMLFADEDYILIGEEVRRLVQFVSGTLPLTPWNTPVQAAEYQRNPLDAWKEQEAVHPQSEAADQEDQPLYYYNKRNNKDEFDLQGSVAYGTKDHIIAKVRRVCGSCFNLTPDDLYKYPTIRVYLMATPGSGKTCMLYSLYLNQNRFLQKNQYKMRWESLQDETVDPFYKSFQNEMEYYEKTKAASGPTEIKFIPPLLMKVIYKTNEKDEIVNVALFDNGGEIFVGKESKLAEQHAPVFNQRILGMDALLCMIDSDESDLQQEKYVTDFSKEVRNEIRKKSKVHSSEMQNEIEQNFLQDEITVGEILRKLLDDGKEDTYSSNIRNNSKKILENLQKRFGGEQEMKLLKEKYFALVISKTDLLVNSEIIPERERKLFFDDSMDYFSEEERQRKLVRDWKIDEWQNEGILVRYNLENFRNTNYHFVAAHIGTREGIQPIRIEEPLIGIVEDYIMQKNEKG